MAAAARIDVLRQTSLQNCLETLNTICNPKAVSVISSIRFADGDAECGIHVRADIFCKRAGDARSDPQIIVDSPVRPESSSAVRARLVRHIRSPLSRIACVWILHQDVGAMQGKRTASDDATADAVPPSFHYIPLRTSGSVPLKRRFGGYPRNKPQINCHLIEKL
jgi:hypothetical protein